jgi:hypothetical protein
MEEPDAKDLAFRLEKYIKGGFAGLLNSQTNYDVKNQLTIFSIKQLEESLRPVAMQVILDFIWNRVRTKLKKRILIVDEAWYLMKNPDSAAFLQGIAKRARKYYLGVTTLTQDIEDFLSSDYGKAILSNSSMQILLKQNSSEVETLASTLNLSEGEKQFLLTAQVGEGLFFAGQNHLTAQFLASNFEYQLVTSKPQDILDEAQRTNTGAAEQFIKEADAQAKAPSETVVTSETHAPVPPPSQQPGAQPITQQPISQPAMPPTSPAVPTPPAAQNPQQNTPIAQAEITQTKINNG